MVVKELDEKIVLGDRLKADNLIWISAKAPVFKTYGVFYDEGEKRYLRVKSEVIKDFDGVFKTLNANTAGGRIRFSTNSPYIALFARQENNIQLNMMTLCAQSGFDIYKEDKYVGTYLPKTNAKNGFCDIVKTDGKMGEYTINFPLFDNVCELYIGLKGESEVLPVSPYKNEGKPVVFYGSSITEGAAASRPGNCYTAIFSRKTGLDYINLGFASKCKGEAEIANYIKGLDMSAFVYCFDHNAKDDEELRRRHYDFYKLVRVTNKDLPIIIVSAPDNPDCLQYNERKEVVFDTYKKAKNNGDNVYFIDGAEFYGEYAYDATIDGVHPNDLGFFMIEKKIEETLSKIKTEI
ncbi:MAG: hypothetical protein IJJ40_05185 [Clostridia bacterium]|nr:hypothetical protein [Clostridia bacterium]